MQYNCGSVMLTKGEIYHLIKRVSEVPRQTQMLGQESEGIILCVR